MPDLFLTLLLLPPSHQIEDYTYDDNQDNDTDDDPGESAAFDFGLFPLALTLTGDEGYEGACEPAGLLED